MNMVYSILGVKTGQSRKMVSKQGSQENKNKVEESDSIQGCMDHKKKADVRIVTQIEVVNNNTEMLIQEKNERVSENSEDKKVDDRGRQNNESGVVQNQECGGEKNSETRNNKMDREAAQASSTNTQGKILDEVAETRRISTRKKKTPEYEG